MHFRRIYLDPIDVYPCLFGSPSGFTKHPAGNVHPGYVEAQGSERNRMPSRAAADIDDVAAFRERKFVYEETHLLACIPCEYFLHVERGVVVEECLPRVTIS
jgi:hypothetical protein